MRVVVSKCNRGDLLPEKVLLNFNLAAGGCALMRRIPTLLTASGNNKSTPPAATVAITDLGHGPGAV